MDWQSNETTIDETWKEKGERIEGLTCGNLKGEKEKCAPPKKVFFFTTSVTCTWLYMTNVKGVCPITAVLCGEQKTKLTEKCLWAGTIASQMLECLFNEMF